jgi:mevalonate kinase
MTSASAPGKIILFGEHAVVYGRPALAVPLSQLRAVALVSPAAKRGIWIDAPDIHLKSELSALPDDHPIGFVIRSVLSTLDTHNPPAIRLSIRSTLPVASGLGSGTAVTVAIIRALTRFLGKPLSISSVNAMAFEAEKIHHGTPSGIDNTVITYGKPVFFTPPQALEALRISRSFHILIGDTGIPAPTRDSVDGVRSLWNAEHERCEQLFDQIGEIVRTARRVIEQGDWPELGPLMDANHERLQQLTVSSIELDRLVRAARSAGALGAKLSGGGRGGNMIALVGEDSAPAVAEALLHAGARRTILTRVGRA